MPRYSVTNLPEGRTNWERLRSLTDEEVERLSTPSTENPEWTGEALAEADLVVGERVKVPISIRLDKTALDAFKSWGPRYQTRLNDLLVAEVAGELVRLAPEVAEAVASLGKQRDAVVNAILRHHAPQVRNASAWQGNPSVRKEQRASLGGEGRLPTWAQGVRARLSSQTEEHVS